MRHLFPTVTQADTIQWMNKKDSVVDIDREKHSLPGTGGEERGVKRSL